jgi:hypothetical protein
MKNTIAFLLFLLAFTAYSQDSSKIQSKNPQLILEFPLVDLPFGYYGANVKEDVVAKVGLRPSGYNPIKAFSSLSMEQSMALSMNTRNIMLFGYKKLINRKPSNRVFKRVWKTGLESFLILLSDQLIPFGEGWQHEEFHKATMTRYNTFTNNTLNDWITGRPNANTSSVKSVNAVLDINLEQMKAYDNPHFARMSAAGGEAEVLSAEEFQKNEFFMESGNLTTVLSLMRAANVQSYIKLCADKVGGTNLTLDLMKEEGAIQKLRDFTGLDYTAWAYDLFNPTEAYAKRGQNPYGNGYDRYIYGDKLSQEGYDWLAKQASLSKFNFLSPMNIFIKSIPLKKYADGSVLKGNFAFRYYPTSFGNQIGINFFLKHGKYNLFINPALNQNFSHNFPSLEAQLVNYPIQSKWLTTTKLMLWTQPKDQAFMTSKANFGGQIATKIHYKLNNTLMPYINVSFKTKGWVAGNVFLNQNFDAKIGLTCRL